MTTPSPLASPLSPVVPATGWSIETALAHCLAVIAALALRQDERFAMSLENIRKAETATDRRFESVNEFRDVLTHQQGTFVTRLELGQIEKQLDTVQSQMATLQAERIGMRGGWGYAVGLAGVVLMLIQFLVKAR